MENELAALSNELVRAVEQAGRTVVAVNAIRPREEIGTGRSRWDFRLRKLWPGARQFSDPVDFNR